MAKQADTAKGPDITSPSTAEEASDAPARRLSTTGPLHLSELSKSSLADSSNPSDTSTDLPNGHGLENGEDAAVCTTSIECAVCLQPCVHPVKLPCSHIFCYLCVKGVANRSKKCALCRTDIPADFVNKPKLLCKKDVLNSSALDDGTQWFYSGNNTGWWRYDPRTNRDIEEKHKEGIKKFELLIAGYLYVIDFEHMVQYRNTDSSRKRNIKRDQEDKIPTKGVAGLMHNKENDSVERESADGDRESDDSVAATPQSTPTPVATATPSDFRNNNRALGFPSPIMHLSPHLVDPRRQQSPLTTSTVSGMSSDNNNDSFISRMRDMQLGDNNPRLFIPRRGNSDPSLRRRRRREREAFSSLRRMNTDSEESD